MSIILLIWQALKLRFLRWKLYILSISEPEAEFKIFDFWSPA